MRAPRALLVTLCADSDAAGPSLTPVSSFTFWTVPRCVASCASPSTKERSGVSFEEWSSFFACMTKPFVAVLTLDLASERKLSIDDRVDRWLPDILAAVAPSTVRQLLQHTSGLFNHTDSDMMRSEWITNPKRMRLHCGERNRREFEWMKEFSGSS